MSNQPYPLHFEKSAASEKADIPYWLLPAIGGGAGALVGGMATRARRGETARERARRVIVNALGVGAVGAVGGGALSGIASNMNTGGGGDNREPGLGSSKGMRALYAAGARGVTGWFNRAGGLARHESLINFRGEAAKALDLRRPDLSLGRATAESRIQSNLNIIRNTLRGTDRAAKKQLALALREPSMRSIYRTPSGRLKLNQLGVWMPHGLKGGNRTGGRVNSGGNFGVQAGRRSVYALERILGGGGRNVTTGGLGGGVRRVGGGALGGAVMYGAWKAPDIAHTVASNFGPKARESALDYLNILNMGGGGEQKAETPSLLGYLFGGKPDYSAVEALKGRRTNL